MPCERARLLRSFLRLLFPWLVLAGLLARLAADSDAAADPPARLSFADYF